MQQANANTKTKKVNEDLVANISSSSLEDNGKLIANVSTNRVDVNGDSGANISDSNTVEVYEGQDVTLTFVMEAYPPIRSQRWTTTAHNNNNNNTNTTVYQESYAVFGYRLAC